MSHKKTKILQLSDFLTGLAWYALEVGDKEEISMLRDETGGSFGILTYAATNRKDAVSVGFIESSDTKDPKKPVAAAAIASVVETDTIVAEIVDDLIWVVAVQNGKVVPGTDAFFSPTNAREQIESLNESADFGPAGGFFIEGMVQESGEIQKIKTFSELVEGVNLKKVMPVTLGGGLGNFSGIFKVIFIIGAIAGGVWYGATEFYFKPIQQAAAAQSAVAENAMKAKRSLHSARSGEEPWEFYLKIDATLKTLPSTLPKGWELQNIKCSDNGCDLLFVRAGDHGGSLVDVADLFGVSPTKLKHGLDGAGFGIHIDFIGNFEPNKDILSEIESRSSGIDILPFSRMGKEDQLPSSDVFRPFFIDQLNDLTKMSRSLKFSITESKPSAGISYSNISPALFYKKGTWSIDGGLWPMSEAIHWIDQLGGFITYLEMDISGDHFKIEGYYLVK